MESIGRKMKSFERVDYDSKIVVYFDFENILTFEEVFAKTQKRYKELILQGFIDEQIVKIIFDCSDFKNSFLSNESFSDLKKKLTCPNTAYK